MNWPHAPVHWLFEPGIYMVTSGTYLKASRLNTPERLDYFLESLFARAEEFGWRLQAWALMEHSPLCTGSPCSLILEPLESLPAPGAAGSPCCYGGQPGGPVTACGPREAICAKGTLRHTYKGKLV